ncbi:NADH-dependent fumarate reductase [Trypanosoma rangeli SC58]|uniref:fumarate reductase (NADH) n=1 Tax=Trypanosoma rangeli SC58 TaxID=429131 RepID=A0A061IZ81_TRYRA|nr:NADH-dependent fumarate reductase [Trypanosoma rangeli SC58]
MDKVQLHPTGLIDPKDPASATKYLGPEALRGSGGVLLNKRGERFVNELDLRSVVSNAIIGQGDEYPGSNGSTFAFCVLNDAAVKLFGVNAHAFYWKQLGLFEKVDTLEDLAALIKCPVEKVRQTLEEYERLSKANRQCPKTRKSVYPCVVGPQGPFYVAFVTPSIHYTMGGCLISPSAEIQMEGGQSSFFGRRRSILGLFGAGEVTGGVHGRNRLGGNSLLECVVFGRIAGDRAAHVVEKDTICLRQDKWSRLRLRSIEEDESGFVWFYFDLPSSLQVSGLSPLQAVALRAHGSTKRVEAYTPFTLPDDAGVVGVVLNPWLIANGSSWLATLRQGDAVEVMAAEPVESRYMTLLKAPNKVVIATSRGIAPMLQILRTAMELHADAANIQLIYLADRASDIPHREELEAFADAFPQRFRCTFVLQHPSTRWTGGVDYVDEIATSVFPDPALGIFLCGATEETRSIKASLLELGHSVDTIATVA